MSRQAVPLKVLVPGEMRADSAELDLTDEDGPLLRILRGTRVLRTIALAAADLPEILDPEPEPEDVEGGEASSDGDPPPATNVFDQ